MVERKNAKLKYDAEGLQNCRDNGTLVGQKRVQNLAHHQFLIDKYERDHAFSKNRSDPHAMEVFNKFYAEKLSEEFDKMKEAEQYMVLTNYIDKY